MRRILIPAAVLVLAAAALLMAADGAAWSAAFTDWARQMQISLQQALVGGVRAVRDDGSVAALWGLGVTCFLYGVFHAVGPGHGKAVLSAYAATADVKISRVVLLSGVAAFMQATMAIILVSVALWVIGVSARWASTQAERVLEPASYAAIALVGAWLAFAGLRALLPLRSSLSPAPLAANGHDHAVHEHHAHSHAAGHDHGAACCGGHHHPPAEAASGKASLRSGLALAVAAGLRPCTGSLLILALCFGLGMWTLGIVASYAIGLGTAITVAVLASGAHAARHPAVWLARRMDVGEGSLRGAAALARIGAGLVIVLLGGTLLQAALRAPAHPLL